MTKALSVEDRLTVGNIADAGASDGGGAAGTEAKTETNFDDIMLAMDVVDTLRHQDSIILDELGTEARQEELIEKLRGIYRRQGIDVSDAVLREGVSALAEDRFVYKPPPSGLSRSLATIYVTRARWAKPVVAVCVLLMVGWGVYRYAYQLPRDARIQAEQVELAAELPERLNAFEQEFNTLAREQVVRDRASELLSQGRDAVARQDLTAGRAAAASLAELLEKVQQTYAVRIVTDAGEKSGVWRVPDGNRAVRNYYLIVEAVDNQGTRLAVPIVSEEDQAQALVSKWGVRVSENVFDQIRRDKQDDGVIQKSLVGLKERGYLAPNYTIPVMGGMITKW